MRVLNVQVSGSETTEAMIKSIMEEYKQGNLFVHPVLDRSNEKYSFVLRTDLNKIQEKEYNDIITKLKQLKLKK